MRLLQEKYIEPWQILVATMLLNRTQHEQVEPVLERLFDHYPQLTDLTHATEKILYAVDKVERQLGESAWIAGNDYTLADINFFSSCGMMVERMFPAMAIGERCPRLIAWREKLKARGAVQRALAGEDRTAPGLRTWTGEAR